MWRVANGLDNTGVKFSKSKQLANFTKLIALRL